MEHEFYIRRHHQIRPEQIPPESPILEQSSGTAQIPVTSHYEWVDAVRRIATLELKIENFFPVNTVPINTLGNTRWELKQPLNVAIEQRGTEDFVACLYDVDLYGYGDTIPEALSDLKVAIVNQFEFLLEQDAEIQLGEALKKQLEILKKFVIKTNV